MRVATSRADSAYPTSSLVFASAKTTPPTVPSARMNGPPLSPRSISARSSRTCASHLRHAVDVEAGGREVAGDRRRHDRQRPATGVAECRADRATPGILRREGERGSGQAIDVEERDIEVRVEQDGDRVEHAAARRGHAHSACARPGHDVRVGDDVVIGDDEPGPDRRQAAGGGRDLERARFGDLRDRPRRGIGRPIDRRPGQRLEADEDVGEPRVVEPAAEPDGDLGRWRKDRGHRPDRGRAAGGLGQARHRPFGQQAAGEPHDQQRLDRAEAGAHRPVGRPEQPVPESPGQRAADVRADRFAEGDRADQDGKDDDRPEGGVDPVQRLG